MCVCVCVCVCVRACVGVKGKVYVCVGWGGKFVSKLKKGEMERIQHFDFIVNS